MSTLNKEEVLVELNKQLDSGNEVGIFKCKYEGGDCYDLIINGNGQNPVIENIDSKIFLDLFREGYLLYPQCTKVGCHWYYDFNNNTRNGFNLSQIYNKEDFSFLVNKKFNIVPKGKSRVYYSLSGREIPLEKINEYSSVDNSYSFTKIKSHATEFDLDLLFDIYCNSKYPFSTYYFYSYSVSGLGWHGNGSREIEKQCADYDVENSKGEIEYREDYCKEFDIVTIDGRERFNLNRIFYKETSSLGEMESRNISNLEERQNRYLNDKTKFKVTFSVGTSRSGIFSVGYPYYKVEYLQLRKDVKPIEVIKEQWWGI